MTISALDPSLGRLQALGGVIAPPATGAGSATRCLSDPSAATGASASVSSLAQLLTRLEQLAQADPGKAATVLNDVATQLRAKAQQDGGAQGQLLNALADRFQSAAQTGDLSSLQPKLRHHGHHHHGVAAYAQQSSGSSTAVLAGASPSSSVRAQLDDVIGQVLSQDLGAAG